MIDVGVPERGFASAAVAVLFSLSLSVCTGAGPRERGATLPEAFEVLRRIVLEENDTVLNVAPTATIDESGLILIADSREARVRIYRQDGRLVRQRGARGSGPGDMRRPTLAYRLPSGGILVADLANGLIEYDSTLAFVEQVRPPLTPLYGAMPISDSTVLLFGRLLLQARQEASPLLHLWDRYSRIIQYSFFPTPGHETLRRAAANFGWVDAAARGGVIATVFSLADSLYFFTRDGAPAGAVPLSIEGFKQIESLPLNELNDPVRRNEWLKQFYLPYRIFWPLENLLVVQYERPAGAESEWNLVGVERAGRRVFDFKNTPKLYGARADTFFFQDPTAITPSKWIVAKLRAQGWSQ